LPADRESISSISASPDDAIEFHPLHSSGDSFMRKPSGNQRPQFGGTERARFASFPVRVGGLAVPVVHNPCHFPETFVPPLYGFGSCSTNQLATCAQTTGFLSEFGRYASSRQPRSEEKTNRLTQENIERRT
jgi:hypothetical protein